MEPLSLDELIQATNNVPPISLTNTQRSTFWKRFSSEVQAAKRRRDDAENEADERRGEDV